MSIRDVFSRYPKNHLTGALGDTSFVWNDTHTLTCSLGQTKIHGTTEIGLTTNINIDGNLIPTHNEEFDLGSADLRWRHLYLNNATLKIGGREISETNGGVKFTGGVILPQFTDAEMNAISNPTEGMMLYNKDHYHVFVRKGSEWKRKDLDPVPNIEFLVIAGGGGGGTASGGGGGAGGMLTGSVQLSPAAYNITIGAGGTSGGQTDTPTTGQNSNFHSYVATGGGRGGTSSPVDSEILPENGGSGGGHDNSPGTGISGQGFSGGGRDAGDYTSAPYVKGGGGGAGSVGSNATPTQAGNGGLAKTSSITGATVYYAGGGGAGTYLNTVSHGLGGGTTSTSQKGGGADGADFGNANPADAIANTGGGGGGAGGQEGSFYGNGSSGGSGIVILKIPSIASYTIGPGLQSTTDTSSVPDYDIVTFTQGTDTITFS